MIIRACIFDLGGTIIDKYSLTPLVSLKKAFQNKGIQIKTSSIRKDMGLDKMDHIHKLCKESLIQRQWYENYGSLINDEEKENIFKEFSKIQKKETIENMQVIPQTFDVIRKLERRNIKTSYPVFER